MNQPPPDPGARGGKQYDKYEYRYTDVGPFRLIAELLDYENGDKINKLSLGKLLSKTAEYRENVINMRPLGRKKLLIFIKNYTIANKMQDDEMIKEHNYKIYVPRSFISITGVITGVPNDMTIQEIQENITCEVPILNIYRLNRFVNDIKTPSNRISVTFRSNKLPDEAKLYCCINKVLPFVNKPMLCRNCLRYGHKTNACRSYRRCEICTKQHEGAERTDCTNIKTCLYCKTDGKHCTTDVDECPEWARQRNIKTIMAKTNLTYLEAKEMNPTLTQNRYELLNNLAEFPTLTDSYSKMTAGNFKTRDMNQYKTQKMKRPVEEVNIADTVIAHNDKKDKKKKTEHEAEQHGVALFNKYRATEFDRWAQQIEKQRQEDIHQQLNNVSKPKKFESTNQRPENQNNGEIKRTSQSKTCRENQMDMQ